MIVASTIILGILFGLADIKFMQNSKRIISKIAAVIIYPLLGNAILYGIVTYIIKVPSMYSMKGHDFSYWLTLCIMFCVIGFAINFVHGLFNKHIIFEKDEGKGKALKITLKVFAIIVFAIGVIIAIATAWGEETWGRISADQMIINMISPTTGTSDEIVFSILKGPVLKAVIIITIFSLICCLINKVTYVVKNKKTTVFAPSVIRVMFLIVSFVVCFASIAYGVERFHLEKILLAFAEPSSYIEENFADPNEVDLKFPEKKRNLIHIYLESVENTYFSKDLGGNMKENLMPELAEISKEGYNFSHLPKGKGFGGHHMTKGATWSVGSMVNMNTGLPMKVPVDGNAYGSEGNFLPGATTLGDILKEQGYNQTLMFGADAAFGGLDFFYKSHGDFKLLDHKGVIEEGWLDEGYKVWWGYEDDKLYEYAKKELTRLASEDKPFNFTMETADTHFPDGYLSKNCKETPYESQYANVIRFSQSETVKFLRWIQAQPFYENTTIVIIGDHLSMDENFFKNYVDPSFDRTCYNLILNPAESVRDVKEKALYNRQWAAFDMFPTILSSLGVEIPGNRLGLGTDLFSGEKTLLERDGMEKVNHEFEYQSDFYNNCILKKCS